MGLVPQRNFSKGMCSAVDAFLQPPGTVPRLNNMLLNKRGSLLGASPAIGDFGHNLPAGRGYTIDVASLQVGSNVIFVSLQDDVTQHLGAPGLPTLSGVNIGGGTLIPGNTYTYQIVATDNHGGFSLPTAKVAIVLPGGMNAVRITFVASEAVTFRVYGRVDGAIGFIGVAQSATFDDDGTVAPGSAVPSQDTTRTTILTRLDTDVTLNKFVPEVMLTGSGGQLLGQTIYGGGGGVLTGLVTNYPAAAWVNNVSPLSKLLTFGQSIIAALGNNHPIYIWDGVAGAAVKLTNTFSAVYPNWIAATTVKEGDYILPAMNNPGAFVFICRQGGVTGGAAPGAFDQNQGGQTVDNNVIWENTGMLSNSPVPPGAAHIISFAGAVVLGNTAAINNGVDGPNVLAFSDVNNAFSWNPRNRVTIAKDDGQQISGMAAFSIADTGIIPTNGLVVFREYSTFLVLGFPPFTTIIQVQTDKGCIAPRTIQYVPGKGIMRLTHLGWAIFDGVNDTLVSEAIGNVIVPTPSAVDSDLKTIYSAYAWFSKAALVSDPTMYLCAVPTGTSFTNGLDTLYAFDPVTMGWMQFDATTFAGAKLSVLLTPQMQVTTSTFGTPKLLSWAITADFGGSFVRSILPGGGTSVAGVAGIAWGFRTPLAFKSESSRVLFKWAIVRGNAWSVTPISITAVPVIDGITQATQNINPILLDPAGASPYTFEILIVIMQEGFHCYVNVAGDRGCEITGIEWETEPASEGMPPRLY